jgi:hypothetical protein
VWDLATAGCRSTLTFPYAIGCVAIATDATVLLGMGHEVIALTLASSL